MPGYKDEAKAMQSMVHLMEAAQETKRLFEAAKMALPEPLLRFLGETSNGIVERPDVLLVPAPKMPPRPAAAEDDWIWVPLRSMGAQGLVLGILRNAQKPMRAKDVTEQVHRFRPEISGGTIANIGNRLSDELIRRDKDGWVLMKADAAPLIFEGHAWGPQKVFSKQEVAAYRRNAIVHLLGVSSDGLQTVQITRMLSTCEWLRAPVSKDLVKMDLEDLQREGYTRRVGNTKKWKLASSS